LLYLLNIMEKSYILCVDDEDIILMSLKQELTHVFGDDYEIMFCHSPSEAVDVVNAMKEEELYPSVLVTDEKMPGMQGHELLEVIQGISPGTYGIILTGYVDITSLKSAVNHTRLFRYIEKPWLKEDLVTSITYAIQLYEQEENLAIMYEKNRELNFNLVVALERASGIKEQNASNHVHRVACFAGVLARTYGMSFRDCQKIWLYSTLHDIGKIGIPTKILHKPGKLEPDEFEIIKNHVHIGLQLLEDLNVDDVARDIILYHHECWDGSGYPKGLKGEEIPLSARISAIADVLDALLTTSPYHKALSFEESASIITESSGIKFDPSMVKLFSENIEEFRDQKCKDRILK